MKNVNKKTGEIDEPMYSGKLNEVITVTTMRPNGTLRIQQDFRNCPTMTEQHTAHLTNLNYLIEKFKPDELAAYVAARDSYRQEIVGHDFAAEPDLQGAKNALYKMKRNYNNLPEEIKTQFKNHVEFLKFIDNPANQEKMIKLGLLKPEEIKDLTDPKSDLPTLNENLNQKQNPKNTQQELKTENKSL